MPDEGTGQPRVTTSLFRSQGPPYLSVGLEVALNEFGQRPEVMLQGYEGYGLAGILVGVVRAADPVTGARPLGVTRDRDDDEPFWEGRLNGRPTSSQRTRLADYATRNLLVAPVVEAGA